MDHHVAEKATRGLDIGNRRRAGIAGDDGDEFDFADHAIDDALLQIGETRIEATIESDHQQLAGLGDLGKAGAIRSEDRSTGFSQNTALPAFVAFSMKSACVVGGRADQHRVDIRGRDRLFDRADPGAGFGRERFSRRLVRVGNRDELGLRMQSGVAAMDLADATGAKKCDANHFSPLFSCLARYYGCDLL